MTNAMKPQDFDAYWHQIDVELSRYAARPVLQKLARRSTETFTVYWASLTSIGPYRIGGYLSIPNAPGQHPALLITPNYGSVNPVPHYNDRVRYVVFSLMHRGQRLADQPFAASYPGLLTEGVENPNTYIYRGIVADCLRGAEFLFECDKVDPLRIAVTGDDLALLTASRRPRFTAVQASGLMFYRLYEMLPRTSSYPAEEINDYLRLHPTKNEAVRQTLSYFDPISHVRYISADTQLSVSKPGAIGDIEWVRPLSQLNGGKIAHYELTAKGRIDDDKRDEWMANKLDASPMSRFDS
jgi:cephalosporin-C deacetylase